MNKEIIENIKIVFLAGLYVSFIISFIFFSLAICVYLGNNILMEFLKTSFIFDTFDDLTLLTIKEFIVISTYLGLCLFIFDKYPKVFIKKHTRKILKTYNKHIFYDNIRTVKEPEDLEELEIYEDEDEQPVHIEESNIVKETDTPDETELSR